MGGLQVQQHFSAMFLELAKLTQSLIEVTFLDQRPLDWANILGPCV